MGREFAFACPAVVDQDGNLFESGSVGLTVRDYFMAHAPAKPQKWFMPTMPPCPIVPSVHKLPEGKLRTDVVTAIGCDTDAETAEGAEWLRQREAAERAQAEWQAEFRKQLYVQWPRAWADAQLEQRA